jgi:hypothetical protein
MSSFYFILHQNLDEFSSDKLLARKAECMFSTKEISLLLFFVSRIYFIFFLVTAFVALISLTMAKKTAKEKSIRNL